MQLSLSEGCRLPVRMNGTDDWPLAEIISIRDNLNGRLSFYVHYVDCKCRQNIYSMGLCVVFLTIIFLVCYLILVNKRLDEWVPEEYLDTRKVQFPRKDGTTTGQNTGATTPKKHLTNIVTNASVTSRPSSPKLDNDNELVNGSAVMAAALQKKINRKRKVSKIICLFVNKWF